MTKIMITMLMLTACFAWGDEQILFRQSDGKILDKLPVEASIKPGKGHAVLIADVAKSVTHVTAQTIPPGQRKKVVRARKGKGITSDTVAAVDVLIAAVPDKKTREALIAIKALIVEELPSE